MPEIRMPVGGGTPPTPATGEVSLYAKPDKRFYMQDDTGAEVKILTNEATLTDLSVTAPLTTTGGSSPTLAINNATTTANGAMPSTDKSKLDGATSNNTANALVQRDPLGNFVANEVTATKFNGPATTVATVPALSGDITTDGVTNVASISAGSIVNADISSSAAISVTKLSVNPLNRANHTGFQEANTLSNLGVEIDSHLNNNAPIVDAMISSSAGIDILKLSVNPLERSSHTGTQTVSTLSDFSTEVNSAVGNYLTTNKLTNANLDDAAAIEISKLEEDPRDRATHTGSQLASTISDFSTSVLDSIASGDGIDISSGTIQAIGTVDRITVDTNGIDIASSYVGQTSITTVGTISSGNWNGSNIAIFYGGTGANTASTAAHNLTVVETITASETLDDSHRNVLVDATSGSINIGLPEAVDIYEFVIKKSDSSANTVVINVNPGDSIEGNTSVTLSNQYDYVRLVSDEGTDWFITGQS